MAAAQKAPVINLAKKAPYFRVLLLIRLLAKGENKWILF